MDQAIYLKGDWKGHKVKVIFHNDGDVTVKQVWRERFEAITMSKEQIQELYLKLKELEVIND